MKSDRIGQFIENLLACIGTATVAALARFSMSLRSVVIGYALIVVALLVVAWRTRLNIFLYQALVMVGVAAFRISMFNFSDLRNSLALTTSASGTWSSVWAIALLAIGIPVAFQLREKDGGPAKQNLLRFLARRPEQPLFFVSVILLTVLLFIKVSVGMVTLAWGIESIVVFLLALFAKERSFSLAGLALLILCLAKIVFRDVWNFSDPAARYLTLIGLGAILLLVSYLYGKNREALRESL